MVIKEWKSFFHSTLELSLALELSLVSTKSRFEKKSKKFVSCIRMEYITIYFKMGYFHHKFKLYKLPSWPVQWSGAEPLCHIGMYK